MLFPAAAFLLASCGDGTTEPAPKPTVTLSASALSLRIGQDQMLTATYEDPSGGVAPRITWRSTDSRIASVTTAGTVRGLTPGQTRVIASAGQAADTALVTVLPPASANCVETTPSFTVGEVRRLTATAAAEICVSSASASEYTIVVTDTTSSSTQFQVAATGTISPIGPPTPDRLPTSGALGSRSPGRRFDFGFEARLRERGRALMNQRLATRSHGARRALLPGRPRAAAASVGDIITLSVDTANDCTSTADLRTARVVAVGARSIIVADEANPTGGLSTEQYQQVATTFDDEIWPSDTENFGEPADIDSNGKIILFYTSAVNELTPDNSADEGFVGGYFFAGDLFPKTECPTGNVAEMFYLLAPDPNGEVNNNRFTAEQVIRQTEGTVAHEFEHLINAARRIYVNDAPVGEETWLDEGLAHVAEELLFYRVSGLGPRANIGLTTLRSSTKILDAVNTFQIANLGRLMSYLEAPTSNGPFEDDDDLETRGAIWEFLRYSVDRKNGDDKAAWFALVNSTTSGRANLRRALEIAPGEWLADFAIAQYTDDAVRAVDVRYAFPSWNFREILPVLQTDGSYPLRVTPLPDGRSLTQRLSDNGGTAYLRAGVAAGGRGSVRLTAGPGEPLPESIVVTVIRTK